MYFFELWSFRLQKRFLLHHNPGKYPVNTKKDLHFCKSYVK